MIKSMTGFGRSEEITGSYKLAVEIKSVNHRYFDLNIKMPKKFNIFEASIRGLLKNYIQRGKVDLYISYEDYSEAQVSLKYNRSIAAEYLRYCRQMEEEFGLNNDIRVSTLAKFPEVISMEEMPEDEEHMWELLSGGIEKACAQFVSSRALEGENLERDILSKLEYMSGLVDEIELRSPEILADYRRRLEEKVRDLLGQTQIDDSRIAAEVVIYADKICVDEETVRLKSHIGAIGTEFGNPGSIGRKLDFIAQEMNREANTILSKANNLDISDRAIALKTEIEKIREQIQNIE